MQSARLGPYVVYFDNSEEYHRIKREVWGANEYYVELENENPTIIDAGAHIGITTLYYKKIFPNSHIIAHEPLPQNAQLFRKNMYENQIENVEFFEAALTENEGHTTLYYDETDTQWYSTAGLYQGAWTGDQSSAHIKVATHTFAHVLQTYTPDLVKMDIEGAEDSVLWSARDSLTKCSHYLIEFHPIGGIGMNRIVKVFEERGYQVRVTKDGSVVPWQKVRGLSMIEATR